MCKYTIGVTYTADLDTIDVFCSLLIWQKAQKLSKAAHPQHIPESLIDGTAVTILFKLYKRTLIKKTSWNNLQIFFEIMNKQMLTLNNNKLYNMHY